jgi:hypothetical protein
MGDDDEGVERSREVADPGDQPGGRAAVDRGCTCSVLANAAYRSGSGEDALVEPDCPVHATRM